MSRRFGVNIQPQLVMLQKTLLNIEGLGRDLDPNIDLWQTAKPFLKRWMSEQMGWRKALKVFKDELPFIIKNAPEMPRLWHQFLSQQIHSQTESPFQNNIANLLAAQHRQSRWQKWTAVAIVILVLLQLMSLIIIFLQ
jgi:ubiquinone biosynthesis protein